MTEELIYKAVVDAVENVVPKTVERVVNGKIKTVQETLDKHIVRVQPVVEFVETLNNLNKFFKWMGITFFAVITIIWIAFKR
jgi:hypothetical protein